MGEVEWGPAVAFLTGGLVLGALILWRVLRRPGPAVAVPAEDTLERRDLSVRLEGLIGQLRELEDTGGKRTEAQHREERLTLELQAARTLIALDAAAGASGRKKASKARRAAAATAGPEDESLAGEEAEAPPRPASALAGFFWGIGSAAALGLLLFFVSSASKERAPGGSVTGNTPMEEGAAAEPGASAGPEIAALQARIQQNPADVDARLDLARAHLMRQDMIAVFHETQAVLEKDPGNARALAYQALVRLAMGQGDQAEEMLGQALRKDPNLLEGYLHLMFVYTRLGKPKQAEETMNHASERFPDRAASLRRLLAQMQAGPQEGPAEGPQGAAEAAEGPAPGPGTASSAGGGPRSVSGVIDLDAAARSAMAPGAIVFVMLRDASFGAGPPLAARRLPASSFPLAFEIGQGDAMAGGQIPDEVLVEARLDSDGDPVTRPRSDPYARQENVKVGTRGLHLVLSPRPGN
jgi:cytochrome c-type biogenesis protein CcmH